MNANNDDALKRGDSSSPTENGDMNLESQPGKLLKNLENVSYIYREDVVRRKNGNDIGFVVEVDGDSDSDSSISDNDYEDEYDDENGDGNDNGADYKDVYTEENDVNAGELCSNCEDESSQKINSDQVRVLWMDGSETTECMKDVEVVDRGFLHGDYVTAASDPTGQIGIVVDVHIDVDLATQDGYIVKGIPSSDLRRIRDFIIGDYVVLGPWLGRIEDVFDNVTVQLDDGSVCKVMRADPLRLIPLGSMKVEDVHFPYYPGQRVKASSSSVFKNARWLSGLWKANRLEGTVVKVTIGSVWIYWIASAGYGPDSSAAPVEEQSSKNLKLLSCFASANWQLGDWCLFPSSQECLAFSERSSKPDSHNNTVDGLESTETVESDSEFISSTETCQTSASLEDFCEGLQGANEGTSKNHDSTGISSNNISGLKRDVRETGLFARKKIHKPVAWKDKKARKKRVNFEGALQIINIKTKLDVVWQDGTIERGLDSASLAPIENPGDHEFVAEQYVIEKASDSDDASETKRVGVVQSVNTKDKTACVRWLKAVSKAEDPREFDTEELVSVYELEGHPDYDYCYGDVVVRLVPFSSTVDSNSSIKKMLPSSLDDNTDGKAEHHTVENGDAEIHEFSDFSWVGNITGLKGGDIEVTWADGMVSLVGPQAIYLVGHDDDESIATESNGSDDAASWETVEDDMDAVNNEANVREEVNHKSDTEDNSSVTGNSGKNLALAFPMAAIGFISRIASGIFSRPRNDLDLENADTKSEDDSQPVELPLNTSYGSGNKSSDIEAELSNLSASSEGVSQPADVLEISKTLCDIKPPDPHASSHDESVLTFKCFDIIKDPSNHHFIGSHSQDFASRKWLKKIQKDWDILQNNLPGSIFVRVYEDRIDLLRTVLVGAYGTPYQDGLFFFDFSLSPEYPDVPPSVYYHSGGWRINPNLYEEGKVCLSLLNTWTGRGNEVWDPSTSSILQVLVSLQGLVLNSKPYFNEAGYDKQVGTAEGEKNSLSYNENTFLLNLKTMMYLMRKPPKGFQELIVEYFRNRGPFILKACNAYMKGHLIGSLTKDAHAGESSSTNSNSVGFKLMLVKLLPKLVSALNEIGANCKEFEHLAEA